MTTGRINQVTTFQSVAARERAGTRRPVLARRPSKRPTGFPGREFFVVLKLNVKRYRPSVAQLESARINARRRLTGLDPDATLSPGLTDFRLTSRCRPVKVRRAVGAFDGNYTRPAL